MISPFAAPETTIAPTMSPASTNAVGFNEPSGDQQPAAHESITPIAMTNRPGTGTP